MSKKDLLRQSMASAGKAAVDKFAQAEKIMSVKPGGLASAKIDLQSMSSVLDASEVGRVVMSIPIANVHDNPFNARHVYNPEKVKSIGASMALKGQLVATMATQHPTLQDHVILVDGHYRKRGLIAAGKSHIDITLREVHNNLDMYLLSYQINRDREGQSVLDNALAWKHLLSEGTVSSSDEIAQLTGTSTAAVTKTMAVLKLPEPAIEKIKVNPEKFSVSIAYEIHLCSKHLKIPELLELMERIEKEDMSSRDIERFRSKLETPKERKKKDVSRQHKIKTSNNKPLGVIKDWDSGRVMLEVNIESPAIREALVENLKQLLTEISSKNQTRHD